MYTTRPISDRTDFTGKHKRSQFDSLWTTTEELLLRELRAINAKNVVMELDLQENQIRLDGRPKANAQVAGPGAAVACELKTGPFRIATDAFDHWQDNVRGIAKSFEALRMMSRYGCAQSDRQYRGWRQIESNRAGAVPTDGMSRNTAEQVLMAYAKESRKPVNQTEWRTLYKLAQREIHPDRGFERKHWDACEAAAAVLGLIS